MTKNLLPPPYKNSAKFETKCNPFLIVGRNHITMDVGEKFNSEPL